MENTSFKPKGVPYNKAQHFDQEWAERVIHQLSVFSTVFRFYSVLNETA